MNNYEKQLQSAVDNNIQVIESYDMGNDPDHPPIEGLYVDGCVALSSDLQTTAQKNSVLAEELAHHDLTVGDILDQRDPANRRQEQKARTLAYDRLIGFSGLSRAFSAGCENRYEVAEYLEVTESFLQEAIERYKEIYGSEFATYIDKHLKEEQLTVQSQQKKSVEEQPNPNPAMTKEEIQRRIERIRKHRKKLDAAIKRREKKVKQLTREGYDFFAAAEARYLDPDRS